MASASETALFNHEKKRGAGAGGWLCSALEFIDSCLQQVELLSTPAHYKVWRKKRAVSSFPAF